MSHKSCRLAECSKSVFGGTLYIAKYVTKESEKIYGKFYFAGGHGLIRKPQTICIDVDFERIPGKAYQVEGMNRFFRYMECYRLDDIPLVGV